MRVLVTGAGGFIGTHLVRRLKQDGHWVKGIDLKYPQWSNSEADEFWLWDLRDYNNCQYACRDMDWVFNLASTMGGAGFIFTGLNDLEIMFNNSYINLNMLKAANKEKVKRYFFSSSACAYPEHLQQKNEAPNLKESDAYPADPDSNYGWEKIYAERLCGVTERLGNVNVRVARYHNQFGTHSTWNGGREKLPAAACRKVALAKLKKNPEIEIWGDGEQTRSFCYVSDCVEATIRRLKSDYVGPINIGTDRAVSVNDVFDIVADIADIEIVKKHINGPVGIRGRNADLTLMKQELDYLPQISLEDGLAKTYAWVERQVKQSGLV